MGVLSICAYRTDTAGTNVRRICQGRPSDDVFSADPMALPNWVQTLRYAAYRVGYTN